MVKMDSEPRKYLSTRSLAAYLDVSEQTARAIIKGVGENVGAGKRYSTPYVILGAGKSIRVSAAAAVDYALYSSTLKDPVASANLPPFDMARAEREIGIRAGAASVDLDYRTMALEIVRQMRLMPMLG